MFPYQKGPDSKDLPCFVPKAVSSPTLDIKSPNKNGIMEVAGQNKWEVTIGVLLIPAEKLLHLADKYAFLHV